MKYPKGTLVKIVKASVFTKNIPQRTVENGAVIVDNPIYGGLIDEIAEDPASETPHKVILAYPPGCEGKEVAVNFKDLVFLDREQAIDEIEIHMIEMGRCLEHAKFLTGQLQSSKS